MSSPRSLKDKLKSCVEWDPAREVPTHLDRQTWRRVLDAHQGPTAPVIRSDESAADTVADTVAYSCQDEVTGRLKSLDPVLQQAYETYSN